VLLDEMLKTPVPVGPENEVMFGSWYSALEVVNSPLLANVVDFILPVPVM
jgi:hypothetical protein